MNGTDRRLLAAQKRADEQKWTRRREDALQEKLDEALAEKQTLRELCKEYDEYLIRAFLLIEAEAREAIYVPPGSSDSRFEEQWRSECPEAYEKVSYLQAQANMAREKLNSIK